MRFGIFSVVDHYPHELKRSTRQFYDELLEQVELADELGFDSFWIAEHHFHEYGAIPRPPIWMAAAAQRTKRIRLGSAVVVLPFDHPLRVAEDYAMVDIMTNGRLLLGVGSGYLAHEFAGFNVPPAEKRERFDESLDIILRAWTGDRFSFRGKHYTVDDVALNVVPIQKPHPPVHIAVLRNDAAQFVGKKKQSLMMIPYATTESIDELHGVVRNFRSAFVESGAKEEDARAVFGLHTYASESVEQARFECKEAMDLYVRTRLYAKQRPFEELIDQDLMAVGDEAEIIRVARRYEQQGFTDFLAITNFGGLQHDRVINSMERIARFVMPAFSKKETGEALSPQF
ncbi:MAG TPA: LLM class flavin-dependent oxidoreductase [Candidatus Obscuribacterales bacterium]